MLERIYEIEGIGLLHKATGKSHRCKKVTLIYGDNGIGKSTLVRVLHSVSTGNSLLIEANKTIDRMSSPKVELRFDSGHKVKYEDGQWTEKRPELLVFDADFIQRNVYSGGAVNTEHRKNLLEFALGEEAVTARQAEEKATKKSKSASQSLQGLTNQLSGFHQGMSLDEFEKLSQLEDVDRKIAGLEKKLADAKSISKIQSKPVPKFITDPSLDIDSIFAVLRLSLNKIHENAEEIVKQHIDKLGNNNAENWLSQGQQYISESCPFCDQDISGNDLIRAYQTHFNKAYADLKHKVSQLQDKVETGTSPTILNNFSQQSVAIKAQFAAWDEHLKIEPITFDSTESDSALSELRRFLMDLVERKLSAPTESLGSQNDVTMAKKLWDNVMEPIHKLNSDIQSVGETIEEYKMKLSSENITELEKQLLELKLTKKRFEHNIIDLLSRFDTANKDFKEANKSKKSAREKLSKLMKETLERYEKSINELLEKFSSPFSIKDMSSNFKGAPRAEYSLELREKDVELKDEGEPHSFSTTLSESDKRTLAFAFFIARVKKDPDLKNRVIVIDDPMCSLDRNRKHYTIKILNDLHMSAQQLIVLAHDIYFLRDLRDKFKNQDNSSLISIFKLSAKEEGYSNFADIDIDKECESPYARHYRLLTEFLNGKTDLRLEVAKSIRPMLEGYLHRRFPSLISKGLLFGKIVAKIRDSEKNNPLFHAKNLVNDLNDINDYAGKFHHDTNPDAANNSNITNHSELKTYVERALAIVHGEHPNH